MAIILPDASDATVLSNEAISDAIIANQNAFIASTTVLINNAVTNGFFRVEPFLPDLVSPTFVKTYFENLGYTVSFPLCGNCCGNGSPCYPYEPCFVAGFPEVLPPGYIQWNCCPGFRGPCRIGIFWSNVQTEVVFLLEDGGFLELEDGSGFMLLES